VNHNCLTHSSISHFNDWEFNTEQGVRVHRVKGNFHTNSASALHEAVKAGLGVARLATFVVQPSLKSGAVVPLLQEHIVDSSTIQLVYPHRRHLSNKVRVFTDFMVEKFTPHAVRIRITRSTLSIKILPSPILPVLAARIMPSTQASSIESATTTSSLTFGIKSITYSAPR